MAVNQRQVTFPHLPGLLQNLAKNSVEYNFSGMVAVKVDFHLFPPSLLGPRSKKGCHRKNSGTIRVCSLFSRTGFNSDLVVDGLSQSLFAAQIFLRGLDRDMAQQKLNLFQLAAGAMAKTGARSSKVMRRESYDSNLACVLLDDMPHHFSVISVPQIVPVLQTQRNNRPLTTLDAASQSSTVRLTHEGTGTVRT